MAAIQAPDVYVLAGLVALDDPAWTYRELANQLVVPHPLVQRALKRAASADLYLPEAKRVHLPNFEELLLHGLRYVAPARLGEVVTGIPAAWAAPPMSELIRESGSDLPPVWPSASGRVRGRALHPLHTSAAASLDHLPALGELLAMIDSIRVGDPRVRAVAADRLRQTLRDKASGS